MTITPAHARGALLGLVLSGHPLPAEALTVAAQLSDEQLARALDDVPAWRLRREAGVDHETCRGDGASLYTDCWGGYTIYLDLRQRCPRTGAYLAAVYRTISAAGAAILIQGWLAGLWQPA